MTHHPAFHPFTFKSSLLTGLVQEKFVLNQRYRGGIGFDLVGPRIVFSRYDVSIGRDQIFSGKVDNPGDVVNISNSTTADQTPAVLKSKGKIAFSRGSGGYDSKLFVMNTDGASQAQLTDPPAGMWDNQPSWSPDGKKIAFTRSYQIWVANADGSKAQSVMDYSQLPGLDHCPSWSPAGDELVFWREQKGGSSVIKAVNLATKDERFITNHGSDLFDGFPAWSPDGSRIAFWRNNNVQSAIWIKSADGLGPENNISNPDAAHGVADRTPTWSPDSLQIAFSRTTWVDWGIYLMNVNGSGQSSSPLFNSASGHVDSYPSWD